MLATDMGAGQAQVMSQKVTQQEARLYSSFVLGTIDSDRNADQVIHRCLLRPPSLASPGPVKGFGQGALPENLHQVPAILG
jgi:hypothetical protein